MHQLLKTLSVLKTAIATIMNSYVFCPAFHAQAICYYTYLGCREGKEDDTFPCNLLTKRTDLIVPESSGQSRISQLCPWYQKALLGSTLRQLSKYRHHECKYGARSMSKLQNRYSCHTMSDQPILYITCMSVFLPSFFI